MAARDAVSSFPYAGQESQVMNAWDQLVVARNFQRTQSAPSSNTPGRAVSPPALTPRGHAGPCQPQTRLSADSSIDSVM